MPATHAERHPKWKESTKKVLVRQAEVHAVKLQAAFKFIEENYANGITLPKIAAAAGLSVWHFHRLFSAKYSITPKNLIADLQIKDAMQRLLNGEKFCDIARACGFTTQSHFTYRFRNRAGETPLRWLRAQQEETE